MHSMGAASNLSRMYCCRAGFSSIETWSPHRSTCDVDSTNCVKTLIKVVLAGSSPLDSGICDDPLALAKASTALSVIVSDAALSNSCSAMPQMAVLAHAREQEDTKKCSRVVMDSRAADGSHQSQKSFAGCPFVQTKLAIYNNCRRRRMRGGCRSGNAHQPCALQNPHDCKAT